MSLLCKLGWHNWDKWQDSTIKKSTRFFGSNNITTIFEIGQFRTCKNCNIMIYHKVEDIISDTLTMEFGDKLTKNIKEENKNEKM